MMNRQVTRVSRFQRGFTLVEMLAVLAILSILSGLVFPTVAGTTSTGRRSQQTTDMKEVESAVGRWNSDFSDFPTEADLNPAALWAAGALPTSATTGTGDTPGTTPSTPLTFSESAIAKIKFNDTDTKDGATVTFNRDYLSKSPDHAADSNLTVTTTGSTFTLKKSGDDLYVKLVASATTKLFPVWGLDSKSQAYVFVNASTY